MKANTLKTEIPKTATERKRAERERHRKAGRVPLPELWVPPAEKERVLRYIERINRESGT